MNTKKSLQISTDLSLPLDAVTNTYAILARRRVGKTYTASVMAEEMVYAGLPFVVLDPTGAWWGLSSSADGKSEGLPVIIIGGPHAHIPLEPSAGKVIADLVVDHPGFYIIDFSRFNHRADEIQFAAAFGERLYRRKQHLPSALHLFIDEADVFVPQKLPKNGKEMFDAYDQIVRRGGVYGLGVTLISQRPALVNKDVLTQCAALIALRTSAPEDQDPIFDKVSRNGTQVQVNEIRKTLASLSTGEVWYFDADRDIFKKVKIRERHTFNSSATPKPGVAAIEPKIFSQIDIDSLGEKIKLTVEKARMDDPNYLRRRIQELEIQVATKPKAEIVKGETQIQTVEVISEKTLTSLTKSINSVEKMMESVDKSTQKRLEKIETLRSQIENEFEFMCLDKEFTDGVKRSIDEIKSSLDVVSKFENKNGNYVVPTKRVIAPIASVQNENVRTSVGYSLTKAVKNSEEVLKDGEERKLIAGEKKILSVIAQYPQGASKALIMTMTQLRQKSLETYIPNLKNKMGYIVGDDPYFATESGILALGDSLEPLPSGVGLYNLWMSQLSKGEAVLLDILYKNPNESFTKTSLSEKSGYAIKSVETYMPKLVQRYIVEVDNGSYRVSPTLF